MSYLLFFVIFFISSTHEQVVSLDCDNYNEDEYKCLFSTQNCGFCILDGVCIDWDYCDNKPSPYNINKSLICGNTIDPTNPYGTWIVRSVKHHCGNHPNLQPAFITFNIIFGSVILILAIFGCGSIVYFLYGKCKKPVYRPIM